MKNETPTFSLSSVTSNISPIQVVLADSDSSLVLVDEEQTFGTYQGLRVFSALASYDRPVEVSHHPVFGALVDKMRASQAEHGDAWIMDEQFPSNGGVMIFVQGVSEVAVRRLVSDIFAAL